MIHVEFIVAYSDNTWESIFRDIDVDTLVSPVDNNSLIDTLLSEFEINQPAKDVSFIGVMNIADDNE